MRFALAQVLLLFCFFVTAFLDSNAAAVVSNSTASRAVGVTLEDRYGYGPTVAVAVDDSRLFEAAGSVLVSRDRATLNTQITSTLESAINDVHCDNDCVYAGTYDAGVYVFDAASAATPIAQVMTSGEVTAVFASGGYLYVAGSAFGLEIFDVTTPAAPTLVAAYDTLTAPEDVLVSDGYCYVADRANGVRVLTVSNPSAPYLVSAYNLGKFWAMGLDKVGDHLFVAYDFLGFRIVDVSNPMSPVEVGAQPSIRTIAVAAGDDYAILATNTDNSILVDVQSKAAPTPTDTIYTTRAVAGVFDGGVFYMANSDRGVAEMEVASNSLQVLQQSQGTGRLTEFAVKDSEVYVTRVFNAFDHVSFAGPARLVSRGSENSWTSQVAVESDRLYVARANLDGINIYDTTNPAGPDSIGNFYEGTDAMTAEGTVLYAVRDQALQLWDVSNAASAQPLGMLVTGSAFTSLLGKVDVQGTLAVVTDYFKGLHVVDVSAPNAPALWTSFDFGQTPFSVDLVNTTAYVGHGSGFSIVGLGDPANPVIVGNFAGPTVSEIVARNDRVYAATGSNGLRVIDVSNPSTPVEVGHYMTGFSATIVATMYDRIVVGDRLTGLHVLADATVVTQATSTPRLNLSHAYPNPTRGPVSFSYSLPQASEAKVAVYDVRGRLVTRLHEGALARSGVLSWQGQRSGETVPAGIYFVVMETATGRAVRKVTIVR